MSPVLPVSFMRVLVQLGSYPLITTLPQPAIKPFAGLSFSFLAR
jgi:hypothetical protein